MAKRELVIKIEDRQIYLVLRKTGEKDVVVGWTDDNDMSKKLLVKLDELFKKSKISAGDLDKISVDSNLSDSYTSTRIAQTVAKAIEFAGSLRITN